MDAERIRTRTKEEIIEIIRERAASYVPEWRFDLENPDVGTALALIWGGMFAGTESRFGRIFFKNRIAFFNELDAKLLPARPAQGYVSFGLVSEEAEGTRLLAGTVVCAQDENGDGELIRYRTQDDVFVSPARIGHIFFLSDEDDFIGCPYAPGQGERPGEIRFFDLRGENLQRHEFYFCHGDALDLRGDGRIELDFVRRGEMGIGAGMLAALADPGCARFSYWSGKETGWMEFAQVRTEGGRLFLYKSGEQPPFVYVSDGEIPEGTDLSKAVEKGIFGCVIRCRAISPVPLRDLEFQRLLLGSRGQGIAPDSICAGGIENDKTRYFPFGERLMPFAEAYFGCKEALGKKGARVCLAFNLSFVHIPLDYNVENDPVKWEWVMKRSDFKEDPVYDVTVEEVLWEYYNGTGWARLFGDGRYSKMFLPRDGGRGEYKCMEFTCPGDIEPVVVGSCVSCYIRARVIKVNNLFKMKGAYVTPVMEDTVFSYDYQGRETEPDGMAMYNNLVWASASGAVRPFAPLGGQCPALYLGFRQPLLSGPLRLFFFFREKGGRKNANLLWEYSNGRHFHELNVVDGTRGFSQSGLVTFMGHGDMGRQELFGESYFWIRILDLGKGEAGARGRPVGPLALQGIFMNTVRIVNADYSGTEYFRMEVYQEGLRLELGHGHVIEASVWVDETESLGDGEYKDFLRQKRLRPVYDEAGVLKEAWVRWRQVEDFSASDADGRDYVLEPNEGKIIFGDGHHGRIPAISRSENIRVDYISGGGSRTNVPARAVGQLGQEIGFINEILNPAPLTGGCDMEPLSRALSRSSALLRHQNRAVTVRDYEELAMAASREVRRVRCFAGCDGDGGKRPGAVTLVVLTQNGDGGKEYFAAVREEIRRFLKGKVEDSLIRGGRLFIVQPEFVEISVRAVLAVNDYHDAFTVKSRAMERLDTFLDPYTGGFYGNGWEIGHLPSNIQIKNAVAGTEGLDFVRGLYVSMFTWGSLGRCEADPEQIGRRRYALPVSGGHEVIIEMG